MTRFGKARLIASVVFCAGAGIASASAIVPAHESESIGGPATLQPDASPAAVGATAPDPAGGLDWAVRTYHSQTGQTCPEAGRRSSDSFGALDDRGRFAALPLEASGSCGDLERSLATFAVNRYAQTATEGARSAVFGIASPAVRSVTLTTSTSTRLLELVGHSFLAVGGENEFDGAVLELTTVDRRNSSYELDLPSRLSAPGEN
jgi:hypothetical protein